MVSNKIFFKIYLIIAGLIFVGCSNKDLKNDSSRQRIKFDFDWKFSKGDFPNAANTEYDDANWQDIDVPHDWSIAGPFLKENASGNVGAYAPNGIGWYRKKFTLNKSDAESKISIEFGGVYMNSEVWINGNYLGKRPFGYISFNYDLTPFLNFEGENILSVKVDNSKEPSARWFTGSGIYRHVWLVKTNKIHIARHGVYVTTRSVSKDITAIDIKTTVENDFNEAKSFTLINEVYDSENQLLSKLESTAITIEKENKELLQNIELNNPELWSPENPYLYTLKTKIKVNNKIIDEISTNVGIRDFVFSVENGFTLNGENMKLKGVNNHSDLGALGAAMNDKVLERRLKILKDMGCNAIRTAHNPPSDVLLDLCDKMGFMVMDEAFDEWIESWPFGRKKKEGKAKYGYHLYFDEWAERDLTELIKRDRNHPSIILWSVGNEIPDACFEIGTERLKVLMDIVRKHDDTRPITCGITHMHLANASGFASALDVTGYNGGGGSAFMYEQDHETYPERKFVATEVPHTFQTRGEYQSQSWYRGKNPLGGIMKVPDLAKEEVFGEISKYYSSSYDNSMVRISARDSWRRTRDFSFMAGEFRWTGFDYLGESMFRWPARLWNFGIIDMCGFPKDTYYFYQSQWTEEPMVHILPHWNWEGKEGVEIPVVAYSNCDSVELFLNHTSLGKKEMGDQMDLVWNVPYESGTLTAKGIKDGHVVCEKVIKTAKEPAKIELLIDNETILANGQEVVHVEVNILDTDNNFVPKASNQIVFKVEGEGTILAVDNGDPKSEESFVGNTRSTFNGKCILIVKSTQKAGDIKISAQSKGLKAATVLVKSL
ncbi:glycoside hydrolase family 2 TIM barrel-domain containing protein [Flavivirga aquimarina]|uniref:Glycoside hydrolase family 2 TIM barrel-domain containing protein n=1 Tax=Flavivirga aquimarina TaxID=2027862 RepID=A0ABT8W900_9FLAO|nr:glycoside hydrolase family 2 TIM barrel-domain containing protein [Flavivirga aquimarina]MDO5969534.1 glycoside hydrolase family 2 TIM barrel-domain containing protein [Flavivirga aquimarina]